MPVADGKSVAFINLYRRCKEWNVLPREGGLMDQDEEEMQALDVVAEQVEQARQRRQQEEEAARRKRGR